MLHYRKDQVLSSIVPVLVQLLAQVQLASLSVDHRVEDLACKHHLRRFQGELLKNHAKLEFGIFEETVADKEDAVPNWLSEYVLSRVSSWGIT